MFYEYFNPVAGTVGGCLVGLSAATLLLFNGDILGASGLTASFVVATKKTLTEQSNHWKLVFTAAFALLTLLYVNVFDRNALYDNRTGTDPSIPVVSPVGFIFGGFFVGLGTRLGNGCTSGHGICGMARLSLRSFAAVGSFMATGFLTASLIPTSGNFLRDSLESAGRNLPTTASTAIGIALAVLSCVLALPGIFRKLPESISDEEKEQFRNDKSKILPAMIGGVLFATGLIVAKMTVMSKVHGFLNLRGLPTGGWDPTLVCVVGGGVIVSFISYQLVSGHNLIKNSKALQCPLTQKAAGGKFSVPTNKIIDMNLIAGELLFGLGWGIGGLCPGPALVLAFAGYVYILACWWPSFFVGSFLGDKIKSYQNKKATQTNPSEDSKIPIKEVDMDYHSTQETAKVGDIEEGAPTGATIS